jgi:hypothetical protein
MRKDRFIVGIICLGVAVWILLARTTIAPAIALAVLGIWGVATASRR